MKEKIDFSQVKALLSKSLTEFGSSFKKGNFNAAGSIMTFVAYVLFLVVFVVVFGRFADFYVTIYTNGALDVATRLTELLTAVFTVMLVFMAANGVSGIHREIFISDDMRLYSAMPVSAKTVYLAKLIVIYFRQTAIFLPILVSVAVRIAATVQLSAWYYVSFVLVWLLLPLVAIALSSVIALPYAAIKQFLRNHTAIYFVAATVVLALFFVAYIYVLNAANAVLLGEEFRYFFNDNLMRKIALVAHKLVPARWFAEFMLWNNPFVSILGIAAVLVLSVALSLLMVKAILKGALAQRISSGSSAHASPRKASAKRSGFFALVKKEFLQVFRTPSYAFSYFSVALVMPIMVYFCLHIGSPLIERLAGIECNLELAVFVTVLFGALGNVFCTTNISREGAMFYVMKAMPVDCHNVFFSKVAFCMAVTLLSNLITATVLAATGVISVLAALFLFAVGSLFGFACVCVATRADFRHPNFSAEEDGEIAEQGSTGSILVLLGILFSVLVGGSVLLLKVIFVLRGVDAAYVTYVVAGSLALLAAGFSALYLLKGLRRAYYDFEGVAV